MNQRILGRTGIKVSEIAFGGVEIGMPYGIGVESEAEMLSGPEAVYLLQEALSHGINFFDTARVYGESESLMGRAFRDRRDRVVLCSKCRPFRDREGRLPEADICRKIILDSLQESLDALKTDFVDVYMLHQGDVEILSQEVVAETFSDLKKRGAIRATGVSAYALSETRKAITDGVWDIIQLPFNLLDPSQEVLFDMASESGTGIMARSVLFKGVLSEKGRHLHPALRDVEKHLRQYDHLLGKTLQDLSTLAIKFALSFPAISSVLVGIDRMDYLNKTLSAADNHYLDEQMLAEVKKLAYPDPDFLDLREWDRQGWLT